MFKLLLTTAPLLATLVRAVPRPNIQQVAQFYEKEISPAKHSATISLATATSTAEPVNIELPFDSQAIEAIKEALEGLPESSDKKPTIAVSPTSSQDAAVTDEPFATAEPSILVVDSAVIDEPTVTAKASAVREPSATVEFSDSVKPTMFDSPSIILDVAPTDDYLSLLGKRAEPSAVSNDELAHLGEVLDQSQDIATPAQETPVTVPTDHSAAFVEGAAALIKEVLKQIDLPPSTNNNPSSLDDSSLSAEPTIMSTIVGTPLASAVPKASDAPSAEGDAISLLGKRDEPAANPTTLATVVQVATARATPDTTAIAIPADAEESGPVATDEPISSALDTRAIGRKNVLYFTNWGIYGANYQPQQLPADQVTHLLYAFADIASDGTVKSSDSYADVEKHYSTDSWNDVGKNAYGCIKQLYILKKQNRKLKTLLSIGGWTWSYKFPPVAASDAGRKQFASSAVKLMADWGFDGIDIDWEYPANNKEANDYILLLKEVRSALDMYSSSNKLNYRFLITVATPAGPAHYNQMNLKGMNPYVDSWHLMAYDYAGSWDTTTGYQSNIYNSKAYPKATKFNTDQAVTDYMKAGISASKIILGLPLYGRSFANSKNVGAAYSGVGGGSIQQGVYNFKDLPRPGARVWQDKVAGSIYSWDSSSKEMVTYDNVLSANWKADYLLKKNLGGAVFWEASGDKTGGNSLVRILAKRMSILDSTQNNLQYPTSQYDNIRKNAPWCTEL